VICQQALAFYKKPLCALSGFAVQWFKHLTDSCAQAARYAKNCRNCLFKNPFAHLAALRFNGFKHLTDSKAQAAKYARN
jgi:hypothetical protein